MEQEPEMEREGEEEEEGKEEFKGGGEEGGGGGGGRGGGGGGSGDGKGERDGVGGEREREKKEGLLGFPKGDEERARLREMGEREQVQGETEMSITMGRNCMKSTHAIHKHIIYK